MLPEKAISRSELAEIIRETLADFELDPSGRGLGPEASRQLHERLAPMRAEDVAAILGDFGPESRLAIFRSVAPEAQAEVLDETVTSTQELLLDRLDPEELVALVERMPPDEAADFVELAPDTDREALLGKLSARSAQAIRELLQYPPDTAGGIMTSDVLTVGPDLTAREVLEHLQETIDTEVVNYVYVVDSERELLGIASIREILSAEPEDPARAFMTTEIISAHCDDDQETVANLAREYNLSSIPVLGHTGRLLGVATIDDLIDVLNEEALEDLARFAGTEVAERPTQRPVLSRALARVPWLLLPGMSGFVVAGLIEGQADQDRIRLWSFLPLVMGISGAVGTQASTILVRGIATGEIESGRVRRVWGQEFMVGFVVAACLSVIVTGTLVVARFAGILDCAAQLPAAVGLGLTVGVLLATISGTLLPFAFQYFKIDPALAAGPFITSLNDILAASSFLWVGSVILTTS